MIRKRLQSNQTFIRLIGIKHNNKETEYVLSLIDKLNDSDDNLICVEKNPEKDLSLYNLQIKRIVGYLRENNTNYKCVDTYDYNLEYLYRYNNIDKLDQEESNFNRMKRLRSDIKSKDNEFFNEIYTKRESEIVNNIKNITKNFKNITIIIGELHTPKIYDELENHTQ